MAGMILLSSPASTATLDPDSPAPQGSMALANILENQGVAVNRVRTLAEATTPTNNNTLVIINSSLIGDEAAAKLAETGTERTVIVGAVGSAADPLVQEVHQEHPAELAADCALAEATEADRAMFADQLISGPGRSCFPGESGAGLLYSGNQFVLADGTSFMNQDLGESGNAALAINLLSTTDSVTWYLPSANDLELTAGSAQGLTDLLPDWIAPAALQMLVLFVILAIWRGRRLGPLVSEDLPIVVPAHETDQGYASLLQRNAQAHDAAKALRRAAVSRLARVCDLPPHASAQQISDRLAVRLDEPLPNVAEILHERTIESDAQLIKLRAQLAQLERKAHNR